MTKTLNFFIAATILFLLSPLFWQLPEILKEESLSPNPVWQVSQAETANINRIRGWHQTKLEKAIAKIAWNRPVIAGEKLIKNLNLLLDPNLFFFGEHPRERLEVQSREKLLATNLPLLLWGLYLLLPVNKKWPLIFISLTLLFAVLGLTNNLATSVLTILLLYPISIAALKLIQAKSIWIYAWVFLSLFEFIYWFSNHA